MQYVALADLASQYLFEAEEQTDHLFARANYFAIQLAKQLNLHLVRPVQPKRLKVRANKTVALPPEAVDIQRVALVRGEELVTLTQFPRLALDRPGGPTGNPGNTNPLGAVNPALGTAVPYQPQGYGYGAQGGYNAAGHYRHDILGGQLLLGEDVPEDSEVYIEYLSSGIDGTGVGQVPLYAEEVILSGLWWKMLPKAASEGVRQAKLEEHKRQNRIAQRFKNMTTSKELREVLSLGDTRSS